MMTAVHRYPAAVITGLFIGRAENRWPDKPPSAIRKHAVDHPLRVDGEGFCGDEQADRKVHGGPEKAIHHYAADHMDFWRAQFPEHAHRFVPGCFGENISTTGLTEDTLCLGDILELGSATVQICQGRQPCWKLNEHMALDTLAARFQKSARTGWYYRVLEAGKAGVGDRIAVIDRRHPDWPLRRVIEARFAPNLDPDLAAELSRLPVLSQSWRDAFLKKQNRGFRENTEARLKGA